MLQNMIESIEIEIDAINRSPKRKKIKVEYYKLLDKFTENYFVYELYVSEYVSKMAEDLVIELTSKRQKVEATITSIEENQLLSVRTKVVLTEEIYSISMDFNPTFLLQYLSTALQAVSTTENPIVNNLKAKIPVSVKIDIEDLTTIDREKINDSQVQAIEHAEHNQITLIWGPPGTGKTHTLSQIIYRSFLRDESILIMSTSNVALDHILLKLDGELYDDEKNNVLRLGNTNNKIIHRYTKDSKDYNEKKTKKVVFSTLANLAVNFSNLEAFDVVMVDEASMVSLPYIFMAAAKSQRNLVMLGDFKQLPPISLNENNRLFQMSVFDYLDVPNKIVKKETVSYMAMLDTQYRMCKPISETVNTLFYNGLLQCGVDGTYPDPLNIIDVDNTSYCDTYFSISDGSYFNPISIPIIDYLLENEIYNHQEVLIVSPFRPQQNLLNAIFQDHTAHKGRSLTIHKAQGSEADVVIVDLTTHKKTNQSDFHKFFITDITANLVNVAISRAKAKLYVICSMTMIQELQNDSLLWSLIMDRFKSDFKIYRAKEMLREFPSVKLENIEDAKKEFSVIDTQCDKKFYNMIVNSKAENRNFVSRKGCIPPNERKGVTFRDIENSHKLPYITIIDNRLYLKDDEHIIVLNYERTSKILKRVALEKFIDTEEINRASTFDLSCSKCDGNYMLKNSGSVTILQCPKCRDSKYIGKNEALLLKDLYKLKCPDCGADVSPRQKKGHSNYSFYGCMNYPHCSGSIPLYAVAKGY